MVGLAFAIMFLICFCGSSLITSAYRIYNRFCLVCKIKNKYHYILDNPFVGMDTDVCIYMIGTGIVCLCLVPWEIPRYLILLFFYGFNLYAIQEYLKVSEGSVKITYDEYNKLRKQGVENYEILKTYECN